MELEFVLKYLQWSGGICPLSSEIYQTLFPGGVFWFQARSEPFHRIKDQMRRLSSDHFNSHLAFGVCVEWQLWALFFSPHWKMYLKQDASWGHIWATLSTLLLMLSETLTEHFTELWLPKVSAHRSGHRQAPSITGSFIYNKEWNKTKPDGFPRRV